MTLFVATLLSGLTLGGIFTLIALGLVLAFRATGTFNFANGEFMLLPAYVVAYGELHSLPFVACLLMGFTAASVSGALIYLVVLRRTVGMPLFMGIVATFGIADILDGIMALIFNSSNSYAITLPLIPTGEVRVFGASVGESSLIVGVGTILLSLIIIAFVQYTQLGIRLRAAGQDPLLASQSGIHVRRVHLLSWVAASILAAIAGIVYGNSTVVDTSMVPLGLAAIPAIMLGGLDSISGAVVGGIAVGIIQSVTQTYAGGQYVYPVTYGLLLVILLCRPQGLLGTKSVVRA